MRTSKTLTLCCLALGLTACALSPPAPVVQTVEPAKWQAPLPHSGKLTDLSLWWQDLGDPLLADLVNAAQSASPSLASARSRIIQSRATVSRARSAPNPTLDAVASAERGSTQARMPVSTTIQGSLQASWVIDLLGANQLANDAAQARLDRAQASWHDARVVVAAEVANRYVSQRACERQWRIAQADAQSRAQTARLADLSLKAGFMADATAALARASAADASGRAIRQGTLCTLDVKALVALTPLDEPVLAQPLAQAPDDLVPGADLRLASVPAQALAQRPDVFGAQREVAAASADAGIAQALQYPQLRLSGSVGALHNRAGGVGTDLNTWSIGPLALTLPLFDGGQREANLTSAQARYDESVALYRARVRQAVREVEEALVQLQGTSARVADANNADAGYRAWLDATETRYQAGLASLVELEDARRTRLAAADTLVVLQLERIQAWIALYRAAGGGWTRSTTTDQP